MSRETQKEGFPITALRETNVLLSLHHPNIVRVSFTTLYCSFCALAAQLLSMLLDTAALWWFMQCSVQLWFSTLRNRHIVYAATAV
jgi:hypothetical protein